MEVRVLPDINDNSIWNDSGNVSVDGDNGEEHNALSILLSDELCKCSDNANNLRSGLLRAIINNSVCRGDSNIILIRSNDDKREE